MKNLGKVGENADEWTGTLEISKEEIPSSKRSMYSLLQALKGEFLSSVFSRDRTLISASAAPNSRVRRLKASNASLTTDVHGLKATSVSPIDKRHKCTTTDIYLKRQVSYY